MQELWLLVSVVTLSPQPHPSGIGCCAGGCSIVVDSVFVGPIVCVCVCVLRLVLLL